MSTPRRRPTFLAGSPRSSGDVQTGELNWTRGGGRVYTSFSGVIVDTLVYSGGGRLNTLTVFDTYPLASGGGAYFYDGHVATSGGPFSTSGHQILGIIFPYTSGTSTIGTPIGQPIPIDMPFRSGLIAAPFGGSGGPGFTISYTPESNILDDGTIVGL